MDIKKLKKDFEVLGVVKDSSKAITFVENLTAAAGFPSPAEDYLETKLDLNDLIKNPDSTFILRINGDSMINDHLDSGDIIAVDGLKRPGPNTQDKNFLIYIPGEGHTVKGIKEQGNNVFLMPRNNNYKPLKFEKEEMNDIIIWGGVVLVIKETWK